jgi:hypothetical protein
MSKSDDPQKRAAFEKRRGVAGRGDYATPPIFAIPPKPDAPETIFGDRPAAAERQLPP